MYILLNTETIPLKKIPNFTLVIHQKMAMETGKGADSINNLCNTLAPFNTCFPCIEPSALYAFHMKGDLHLEEVRSRSCKVNIFWWVVKCHAVPACSCSVLYVFHQSSLLVSGEIMGELILKFLYCYFAANSSSMCLSAETKTERTLEVEGPKPP